MDPEVPDGTAIAMNGHLIVAVGSDAEIARYVGPQTEVFELEGRFVMPGFIEGHGHFLSLGRARQILVLEGAERWRDIVSQVAIAADSAEPGEWIFGRGWHQDKWLSTPEGAIDGVPLNASLNAVSPNNPVLLGHASGHAAFANDAALAAAGIDTDTPDPAGGTIVRSADGTATGLLRETAQRLVASAGARWESRRTPAEQQALFEAQVQLAGAEALQHGVTSFHDAGASFAEIDALRTLAATGELPIRLYVMVRGESNDAMAARLSDYYQPYQDNSFLTVRSIKRQIDGALGAHGAWLLEPYVDLPESAGLVLEPVADIERTAQIAVAAGFQVNTHAIGDRANRETLDLYERSWQAAEADGKALRWRIEHAQHIDPEDVPRFGELGVIAAIQGVHCASDGPWIPSRLGAARTARTSYPWRDLIDSGALLANGTDVPVEPIDAIASFAASVTRIMNNGEAFYPEQAMSRQEALASYTINNAFAAFEEDVKGSLTPGKLADIVVLSNNLLTVSDSQLPKTQVEMTFVGGQLRYARLPEE
ncbi:MAG: amidohydrolase [Pseudomonadales bacterium]